MLFDLSVRLSFPGLSLPLDETGRAMAAWTQAAASILAPELTWTTTTEEKEDLGTDARWGTRIFVELIGRDPNAKTHGRARLRLAVGGDATRAGASSSIEIETVQPPRHLHADNHCDVTHWDLTAAPVTEAQVDALRRALEDVLERSAKVGGERRDPLERAAQLVTTSAEAGDAALWIEDLASVGIESRGHATAEGVSVFLERMAMDDVEDLDEARVVLGEVLSEAGHEDWHERARRLLVRLPGGAQASSSR